MRFAEHVKIREEKFGSVIFETLKEKIYVTNQTGKDILTLLKDNHTSKEIIDLLTDKYSENKAVVERDVNEFIETLFKNGLVKNTDSH